MQISKARRSRSLHGWGPGPDLRMRQFQHAGRKHRRFPGAETGRRSGAEWRSGAERGRIGCDWRHPRQPGLPDLPRSRGRILDSLPGGLGPQGVGRARSTFRGKGQRDPSIVRPRGLPAAGPNSGRRATLHRGDERGPIPVTGKRLTADDRPLRIREGRKGRGARPRHAGRGRQRRRLPDDQRKLPVAG